MCGRRKVLELFCEQKETMEERINQGIENYRKGFMKISVKDKDGNPVSDAKIRVNQKSHEFKFGANIFMLDELETEEKNEAYKNYFADIFNIATLPFYWNDLEPQQGKTRYHKDSPKIYRRPNIDLCMEFCEKHNIEPREHALAYEHHFPAWLKDATVEEIKLLLEKRYKEISDLYKDKIPTIEVTNEINLWKDGQTAINDEPDFIEWAFKLAEKYFPQNELTINEYADPCWENIANVSNPYYAYIENNLLKGARIDAIGMQYHLFFSKEDEYNRTRPYYDPENLYKHMDLFARFNKPLQVTEVTIPAYSNETEDEELQADIIELLYSIWFSHPNMEQIIYWNLVDGYAAFAPQGDMTAGENYYYGGLLRFDLTPKPAYLRLKKLIGKVWHTEEETITNENGLADIKGFFGEYDVTVLVGGEEVKKTVNLSKNDSNEFEIEI